MNNYKGIFLAILVVVLLSGIKSFADTFVVTNLNDPGAGSLRQAIDDSNSNEGPDTIVFEEGLQGTISMNLGEYFISDDVGIIGPGPDNITIDAEEMSPIFIISDGNDQINRVVNLGGLRLINGRRMNGAGGIIENLENLTVENCEFINGDSTTWGGGAIFNDNILTVESCHFEDNRAYAGGNANLGGAILNVAGDVRIGIIIGITDSVFINNPGQFGGAVSNQGIIEMISNTTFSGNSAINGGAILNASVPGLETKATIKEISNCTFNNNSAVGVGGAIFNSSDNLDIAKIEKIVNSTFYNNASLSGSAIRNDGLVNISFSTIANNPSPTPFPTPPPVQSTDLKGIEMERGGIVTVGLGITRVRNSIIASNSPDNCFGLLDDFGGNYSDDFTCGLTGDDSLILLGPLADNGGPTETIALLGGDPVDGATVNCDALNDMGNPSGVPIGIDQRYFPRPSGVRCDSGAYEAGPESNVTITKASDPPGGEGFEFESDGFDSLVGCGFTGDNGHFILDDGDSIGCRVPVGNYTISENVPAGYEVFIVCFGDNENLIIDNDKGEIVFSVPEIEPSPDVDCLFTNVRIRGGGGGGCTLAPAGAGTPIPLYLLIPVLIFIRRFVNRYRR